MRLRWALQEPPPFGVETVLPPSGGVATCHRGADRENSRCAATRAIVGLAL
jgi:hypothetical protein